MKKLGALAVAFVLSFSIAGGLTAFADDEHKAGHSHEAAQVHGGDVSMTTKHHFEVVFAEGTIRVYPYGNKQEPLAAKGLSGKVSVKKKGSDKAEEAELKYVAADAKKGISRDYLEAAVDLKGVAKGEAKITIDVTGLTDNKDEAKATFTVTYNGSTPKVEYVCPMKCEGGRSQDPAKCPKCKMEMKKPGEEKKGHDHGDHDHGK